MTLIDFASIIFAGVASFLTKAAVIELTKNRDAGGYAGAAVMCALSSIIIVIMNSRRTNISRN